MIIIIILKLNGNFAVFQFAQAHEAAVHISVRVNGLVID